MRKFPTIFLLLLLTSSVFGQWSGMKPMLGRQANRAHPLAPDADCLLMNEGSGNKVSDLSGNGNNGTLVNDTHFVTGKFGGALEFDGTGDYVTVADNPTIDLAGSFTILVWIKPGDITTQQRIVAKNLAYYFEINTSKLRTYCYGLSAPGYHSSNGAPTINVWQQVAVTYDGTAIRFYFNGISDGSAVATTGSVTNTANALTFGGVGIGQPYLGQIDHAMIYNRALSASEIALLYRKPFCFMEPSWNPILYGAISAPSVVPTPYYYRAEFFGFGFVIFTVFCFIMGKRKCAA